MTAKMNQVLNELETLSASEKGMIAQYLIATLDDKEDANSTEQWAKLAKNRYESLVLGEVNSVSWENIRQNILG
ncbi:MAG TPA: addiction module antitoxin RelB [Epsilonproteobacteria bacterium]|nr:addiction module antitoxin RelB [Campylobacterota bacterium]